MLGLFRYGYEAWTRGKLRFDKMQSILDFAPANPKGFKTPECFKRPSLPHNLTPQTSSI